MKNITQSEFAELRKRIFFEFIKANVGLTMTDIVRKMNDFEYMFNGGLADMLAFIKWADKHKERGIIAATVLHDLCGCNDVCFLPRTDGYYKEAVNE